MDKQRINNILQTLKPVDTHAGSALLAADVHQALQQALELDTLPIYQLNKLMWEDFPGHVLLAMGYGMHPATLVCEDNTSVRAYPPDATIKSGRNRYVHVAQGLRVRAPVFVAHEDESTLVALQMLGPAQAVNASWAALVGGGKQHYLNGIYIKLGGSKNHHRLDRTLQCGWKETWLVHKQAIADEMDPSRGYVYILHDGRSTPPPAFYFTLDQAISIPILPAWKSYLWASGRQQRLINLVDPAHNYGIAAWRVTTGGWE